MKVSHNAPPNAQALEINKASDKGQAAAKQQASKAATTTTPRSGSQVEISDDAVLLNRAREAAMSQPDIRAEKVASLKKQIRDGNYKIDSAAVADKLVDEHLFGDLGQSRL